jgi:hypothetical protein
MSTTPDHVQSIFPESNVDSVVSNLWSKTIDLDGSGLVEMFRLLTTRAEQIKGIQARLANFDRGLLTGDALPEQAEVDAALLEGFYDTTCLKWFLSRACEQLAKSLEYDVYQKQDHMRRIESIAYNEEGEVESFRLEKT